MNDKNRAFRRLLFLTTAWLLFPGCIAGLRAETPPSGTTTPEYGAGISPVQTKRMRHLAPRHRSQHTFFVNAGYTAVLSTLYFKESTSGSLNEGHDITAGYNWTSRRGFGVGVIYSGGFISAERNGFEPRNSPPGSGRAAGGSSAKAPASATDVTSGATATCAAAGAESASTNRPRSNSC